MKAEFKSLKLAWIAVLFLMGAPSSYAFEAIGLISYNVAEVSPKPSTYTNSSNGIGYTFLGRVDFGPGQIESGFQFTPTSISTHQLTYDVSTIGSYWVIPLMYRYTFFPPFLSAAVGADYAVVGTNNITVSGAQTQANNLTSGYRGHFGVQASFEVNQDLGEDLSAVLDLRYRAGLANAISFGTEGAKYNFFIIALGIQKHLE